MRVSVIIPTYNRANLIDRALDSVETQDYPDIECIVVDDASTDETQKVVESHELDILYRSHKKNKGVTAARNFGIRSASGDLILFLDSDDELTETAVSNLVSHYTTTSDQCACVFGKRKDIDEQGNESVQSYSLKISLEDYLNGDDFGGAGGKMYPAWVFEKLGLFDENIHSGQTLDYFLRLTDAGYHFESIRKITFNRYLYSDNLGVDFDQKVQSEKYLLEKHRDKLPRKKWALRLASVGRRAADLNRMSDARKYFRWAIKLHPSRPLLYYYFFSACLGRRGYSAMFQFKKWVRRIAT